ncbi:probable transcriptional regulator protein, GntR family [Roseobacter sp. SK209-2-6]|nr:probable transcriptional regulator protein, GntR family [Roseobacter sp. SK209-2-6]
MFANPDNPAIAMRAMVERLGVLPLNCPSVIALGAIALAQWIPSLLPTGRPRYIELAEAIRTDIESGILKPGDRLPPQRGVAQALGVDFSTVSRGYAEAVRRGDIESFVGRGTFVRETNGPAGEETETAQPDPRRSLEEDPMMNMPPEPEEPQLLRRMAQGVAHVSANLVPLLRYQSVTGSAADRDLARTWMQENGFDTPLERLAISPGAHASIYAILTLLTEPGQALLCEAVTYPGLRSIAGQLGVKLIGVKEDEHGIIPEALEALITEYWPAGLYLNPTLSNPRTRTIPKERRFEIAEVLKRFDLPLIEDDAYCFIAADAPAPISSHLPDLGWHIAGISKVFGAGLRLAYTTIPNGVAMGAFAQIQRSMHIMPSPLSLALMGRWIEDGTAAALQANLQQAARERQALAADILQGCRFESAPEAFCLWVELPKGTSRAEVMGRMANRKIGILPSDAFTVAGEPQEAVRVCLGGPISMAQLREDLLALQDALMRKDWLG